EGGEGQAGTDAQEQRAPAAARVPAGGAGAEAHGVVREHAVDDRDHAGGGLHGLQELRAEADEGGPAAGRGAGAGRPVPALRGVREDLDPVRAEVGAVGGDGAAGGGTAPGAAAPPGDVRAQAGVGQAQGPADPAPDGNSPLDVERPALAAGPLARGGAAEEGN